MGARKFLALLVLLLAIKISFADEFNFNKKIYVDESEAKENYHLDIATHKLKYYYENDEFSLSLL